MASNQRAINVGDIVTYWVKRHGERTGLVINVKESPRGSSFYMTASVVPVLSAASHFSATTLEDTDFSESFLDKVPVATLTLFRIGKYVEYLNAVACNKLRVKTKAGLKKEEEKRTYTVGVTKGLYCLDEGDRLKGTVYDRSGYAREIALEFVCIIKSSNRIRCRHPYSASHNTKSWHPDDLRRVASE